MASPQGSPQTNFSKSLHHRILSILLQNGFTVVRSNQPLSHMGAGAYRITTAGLSQEQAAVTELPWVFMSEAGEPSRDGIVVKEAGVVVNPADYTPNFVTRMIHMLRPVAGAMTMDVRVWTVRVREGYPDRPSIQNAHLPMVAWEVPVSDMLPFSVGSATVETRRMVTIDVLGDNAATRDNLGWHLCRKIVRIPLFDFSDAGYINPDGTLNHGFNQDHRFIRSMNVLREDHPELEIVRPHQGSVDKEKWRATVTMWARRTE